MGCQRSLLLASACAYALGLATVAGAQNAPAQKSDVKSGTLEEVVITGSFIRGTPEDSAVPVEVMTFEEIQNMGRPSNMDLVKNMSESGGVAGEANRVNFYPIGAATINLRSVGARFTTVVFNGRRFPEQFSVNTGRFNNIAWIPNAAVGSVETLKAGGGATYGADAVAGVVNYVTRKNFDGLELNGDYRYIEDSDGDYGADILWGSDLGAAGNLLVSASYQHRSTLMEIDRDWSQYSFLENPVSWFSLTSPISNPGTLVFQRPVGGVQTAYTPANLPTSDVQMSAGGSLRDLNCTALGGFAGWSATPTPGCYSNTAEMEELVSEQNSYNLYLEHNVSLGESLKFHTEALLYRQDVPNVALASTFVSNPAAWPLAGAPGTANRTQQAVGATNAYFVPGANPATQYLLNNLRNSNGSTVFSPAQIAEITAGGQVGLQNFLWKPFGNGGSPFSGEYDRQEGHLKMYRFTEAVSGNLPEFWGTSLEWEVGFTWSKINDVKQAQDILVDRLQAALNGFGGFNCTGTTPGANGCQYFNPYSSAVARNVFTGATNPGYVGTGSYAGYTAGAGLSNSRDLVDWMYVPIQFERIYKNYVFDPIIRGDLGINLPGGPIAVAVGGQFRRQDEEVVMDDWSNRAINPCTSLGVTNCAASAQIGAFTFNRQGNVFGAASNQYRNEKRHYPVAAGFFETKLPLLESLDLSLAGRYEKFFSDVTEKDNTVFVPAAAIKWQPLDWVGIRTSWGKTFSQVNPPRPNPPLQALSAASAKYTGVGGAGQSYTTNNYPNRDVEPEKGDYLDVGFLFSVGNFTANIDYYDITIGDYTRQMTAANVLDALAMPGSPPGPAASTLVNCASGALTQPISAMGGRTLVELPGACQQGVTNMTNLIGGTVNFFGGVGQTNSGELQTSGIDLSASYRFDNVLGGSITPTIDVSRVLKWELGDFVIGGVKVANGYDGLGYVNLLSGRIGQSVAKYRASLGIAFRRGDHTLNILSQYVPSIINEDTALYNPSNNKNANIGDASGVTANGSTCTVGGPIVTDVGSVPTGAGTGQFGTGTVGGTATTPGFGSRGFCAAQNATTNAGQTIDALFNIDMIYRVKLPMETSATLTINNVLNKDPSFYRGIVPYNTSYGSPLGRTIKIGVSKSF